MSGRCHIWPTVCVCVCVIFPLSPLPSLPLSLSKISTALRASLVSKYIPSAAHIVSDFVWDTVAASTHHCIPTPFKKKYYTPDCCCYCYCRCFLTKQLILIKYTGLSFNLSRVNVYRRVQTDPLWKAELLEEDVCVSAARQVSISLNMGNLRICCV